MKIRILRPARHRLLPQRDGLVKLPGLQRVEQLICNLLLAGHAAWLLFYLRRPQ
jgi:hypothetical protein